MRRDPPRKSSPLLARSLSITETELSIRIAAPAEVSASVKFSPPLRPVTTGASLMGVTFSVKVPVGSVMPLASEIV